MTAVNAAIAKLNYVPNRAARSLASRTSGAIALIVPEDTAFFFGDPYFAAIVQGITRRLDDSDYLLNLLVASTDPGHKTVRYLRSGVVDGALVISHHEGARPAARGRHAAPARLRRPSVAARATTSSSTSTTSRAARSARSTSSTWGGTASAR